MRGAKTLSACVLAGIGAWALGTAEPAQAQVTDHLQCYKAKDDKAAAQLLKGAVVNLSGSLPSSTCQISKLTKYCSPVAKQLVEPTTPINPFVGPAAAGSYACYKVKCDPKSGPGPLGILDQFGDRTVDLGGTFELCAPVAGPLDGVPFATSWIDLETGAGELPAAPFGTCDTDGADRVGLQVSFQDGTTASAVYSGVSALWNTGDFAGILPDVATGFLATCPLHFLFNNGTSLPLAWDGCIAPASSNFDLDYSESDGSNFRADTTGWGAATFQTYCGD